MGKVRFSSRGEDLDPDTHDFASPDIQALKTQENDCFFIYDFFSFFKKMKTIFFQRYETENQKSIESLKSSLSRVDESLNVEIS